MKKIRPLLAAILLVMIAIPVSVYSKTDVCWIYYDSNDEIVDCTVNLNENHIVQEKFLSRNGSINKIEIRAITWNNTYPEDASLSISIVDGNEMLSNKFVNLNQFPDNQFYAIPIDPVRVSESMNLSIRLEYVGSTVPNGNFAIAITHEGKISSDSAALVDNNIQDFHLCLKVWGE